MFPAKRMQKGEAKTIRAGVSMEGFVKRWGDPLWGVSIPTPAQKGPTCAWWGWNPLLPGPPRTRSGAGGGCPPGWPRGWWAWWSPPPRGRSPGSAAARAEDGDGDGGEQGDRGTSHLRDGTWGVPSLFRTPLLTLKVQWKGGPMLSYLSRELFDLIS